MASLFGEGHKKPSRDGFGSGIVKLGEKNKNVVVLCASVGDSTRAYKFRDKFPGRYIEAGIAEANMIGMACGLALAGKIPYATSFATFLPGRCYDHIRQSVCYSNLNVKLVATHAGLTVGGDGATHQMMEDIAIMRATPNIKVIVPCDAIEAEKATLAVASDNGPCYIRLGREEVPIITDEKTEFKIGKANVMKKGKDVVIIACGIMVWFALKAADALEKKGINATVINNHTIKPMDRKTIIDAAKETKAIVTAEEHQIYGGLGSAVAEVLAEEYPVPMEIIGMKDRFGESGKAEELLVKYGLTPGEIIRAVERVLERKRVKRA